MSRMRGTPTLGPYSRTDSRPGRLADSGSTLIAPDTPSMSKVSTTAHRVSPGQIPLTGHLPLASRPYTAVIPTAYPVIPAKAGIQGWRGWVPVSTGTTGGRASLPSFPAKPVLRISVIPAQEDPCTVIPATESRGGGDGFPRTTGGRASLPSFPPNQYFAFPSFPRRKTPAQPSFPTAGMEGMGSRLHGNDGRQRVPTVIPAKPVLRISVIPAQEDPCTTVIPATAGIQGWRGWVPVSTGTTGGSASLPSFLPNQYFAFPSFPRRKTPAQPSFPRRRESRGGGDGFPSPRERRALPVSAASPPLRREYIVSTFTRTGRRRVWRRRSRSGAAPPCPRASPARRRRRIARASAPSCRSGSGSRPS